jgi:aspartate aminotransferase-like enzyme
MSVRAGREFLAIPGPTTIPDEVLRAMHRPAVDIYSGPLLALTDGLMRDVARRVQKPKAAPTFISPNGHGAWEAALTNVLSRGDICDAKCGVILGHGIGELSGKAFRIAHTGHVNAPMVLGTLSVIEMGLAALRIPHGRGGTQAAIDWLGKQVKA